MAVQNLQELWQSNLKRGQLRKSITISYKRLVKQKGGLLFSMLKEGQKKNVLIRKD